MVGRTSTSPSPIIAIDEELSDVDLTFGRISAEVSEKEECSNLKESGSLGSEVQVPDEADIDAVVQKYFFESEEAGTVATNESDNSSSGRRESLWTRISSRALTVGSGGLSPSTPIASPRASFASVRNIIVGNSTGSVGTCSTGSEQSRCMQGGSNNGNNGGSCAQVPPFTNNDEAQPYQNIHECKDDRFVCSVDKDPLPNRYYQSPDDYSLDMSYDEDEMSSSDEDETNYENGGWRMRAANKLIKLGNGGPFINRDPFASPYRLDQIYSEYNWDLSEPEPDLMEFSGLATKREIPNRSKRVLCIIVTVLGLLLGAAATVYFMTKSSKAEAILPGGGNNSPVPSSGGYTPIYIDDPAYKGRGPEIGHSQSIPIDPKVIQFLSKVTSSDLLSDRTSPQSKAAAWLMDDETIVTYLRAEPAGYQSAESIQAMERYVIATLYFATSDGRNELTEQGWKVATRWLSDSPVCEWHGVLCGRDFRVKELRLPDNNLSGPLPAEVGELGSIEVLDLSRNQINGALPGGFGRKLPNLVELRLSGNIITGDLVAESIGSLGNLVELHLDNNMIQGAIPYWIDLLESLKVLNLSNNQLMDPIPKEIGQMPLLEVIDLSNNQLEGVIPEELGQLNNLRELKLSGNELRGVIPVTFVELSNLEKLWLDNNSFTGELGGWVGILDDLEEVRVENNDFAGEIPSELGIISGLRVVSVQGNGFSGSMPDSLCQIRLEMLTADCSLKCNCCTMCYPA